MYRKTLKQRILEASLTLFQENGYHGVTVDQIVELAGTSKGGFYHNFKSKDELLYEIHDVFISYVIEKAQESYNQNGTPVSRLNGIMRTFIKVFDVYKPYITVFYEESAYLQDDYRTIINSKRDEYRRILERVIREGQENGDFRKEIPTNIAAMAIIGMVNWTYKWFKKDGPLKMEQITDIFNDLILHSLATEKGFEEAKHINELMVKQGYTTQTD